MKLLQSSLVYVVLLSSSRSIVLSGATNTLRGGSSINSSSDGDDGLRDHAIPDEEKQNQNQNGAFSYLRDLLSFSNHYVRDQQRQQHRRVIAENGGSGSDGDTPSLANLFANHYNDGDGDNFPPAPSPSYSSSSNRGSNGGNRRQYKESRIIGGSETGNNEFPFAVSIQDMFGHFCGGTLIAPNIVLTAAHCLGGTYDVVVGRHNLNSNNGQSISMKREFPHPDYNAFKSDNDFGLIVLTESATNVDVVKLNPQSSFPSVGSTVTVAGYGDTAQSDFTTVLPESLMKVNVNVISNADCEDSSDGFENYYNAITSNMLCARVNQGGKDACQGDSGGPLFASNGNGYMQVGVVSWGIGCATKEFPGVYSRVSSAYEWIRGKVCEHSASPKPSSFNCGESGSGSGGGGGAASISSSGGGSESSSGTSSWTTVFETDFTNGIAPFIDDEANAQRLDEAKFREGVIHLQNQGEMRTQSFDVHSYAMCRTKLDFMLVNLDPDDEWCVDYSSNNGSSFERIRCYNTNNFQAKKWWDGRRAPFSVQNVNNIRLRLKSKGDSAQDDVLISSAKLECR